MPVVRERQTNRQTDRWAEGMADRHNYRRRERKEGGGEKIPKRKNKMLASIMTSCKTASYERGLSVIALITWAYNLTEAAMPWMSPRLPEMPHQRLGFPVIGEIRV